MLAAMIMSMIYAKALGVTQGIMAREVYGDIWIATAFATVKGLLIMLLCILVIRRAPTLNMLEQTSLLLGKWSGKVMGILLFLFFAGSFATVMVTFVYHLMDYFLPVAPTYLFFIIGLGVCLYGLYKGLEVIGRTAFLAILAMVIFNILMILGSLQQMDVRELQPTFQSGVLATLWASRHNDCDWATATMMTSLMLPVVTPQSKWYRAGAMGILLGGMIVILWPLLETTVLSPEVAAQYIVSCMQLARSAEIGVFMQRYEMIMVAMFIIPLFVQMMMNLYCAACSLSHVVGARDIRYMFPPVIVTFGAFSYWVVNSHFRAIRFIADYWPYLALPVGYGVPILILAAGWLRKGKLEDYRRKHAKNP